MVQNGATIASSANPQGWNASFNGNIQLTVPANAAIGTNYEVRVMPGGGFFRSSYFDVYASSSLPQVPQGGTGSFTFTGNTAPGTGLTWDILSGTNTVATSANPLGWNVSYNASVTAPPLAPVGTYTVRSKTGMFPAKSSGFQVYAVNYLPKAGVRYLIEPNGARIPITASAVPTAATPVVTCTVPQGVPMLVKWKYLAGYTSGYYAITMSDNTTLTTTTTAKLIGTSSIMMVLGQITDRNGNSINLYYGATGTSGFPLLTDIADNNNNDLVTFSRNGAGNLTAINDRYGRSIVYRASTFATANVPAGWAQSYVEVDHVSQIVATGTTNPPDRYAYGYYNVPNGEFSEQVPFLHTITVPSPTGTGNATATINYTTDGTSTVSSIVDANGNSRNYSATDANHTKVTIKDPLNAVVYSYTAGFDANMSGTTQTNGANVIQATKTFASPNTPYRPSSITDALGRTSSSTWDQFGNCLTYTTPRNVTTTNTISYANFVLGRLTQVQQGTKTATNLVYFEPSGLPQTISSAKPGTVSTGQQETTSYTWDGLGNILTLVAPGNNATATNTTTFNYMTDGAYTQSSAIGQPLKVTDNLGHATHFRYDTQGRRISTTDALGNESDMVYNLIGQTFQSILPSTGQTGSGHSYTQNTYQYIGGPLSQTTAYDESALSIRQVVNAYGAEGETLSVTGSTEPVSFVYDALYRLKTLTDGNIHSTSYSYNTSGYLSSTQYPGGDTLQYTSYDNIGNLLSRTDGRGVVINYIYNDPENKLTAVQYPASTGISASISYDTYGRKTGITDGTGNRSVSYDDTGNQLALTTTYTGIPTKTISYGYFADGSLNTLTTPAGTFTYTFDAAGRVTGLNNAFNETFSWTYLDNNWIWTQTSGSAVKATYTYNALGQVTRLLNSKLDTTTLSDFSSVSYDGAGNRKNMTSSLPASASYSGTTSYNYDAKDQLTQETSSRVGGYTNNFGFDSAGNATNFKGVTQTFNSNNQNTANTYDLNGNPTTNKGATCTFDAENRMTSYGSVMTAGYLAGGLRAWKQTSVGRTYYLYAAGVIPVCEMDASGNVTATNTIWSDGLLSRRMTSSSFYAFDLQGSTSHRLDSSGNTLSTSTFDAFGTRATNDTSGDPYAGFGGKFGYRSDIESGLQLLGIRYYDPSAGRFVNRDPIGYEGGVNVYDYVGNTPNGLFDPSGTDQLVHVPGDLPGNPFGHWFIRLEKPCDNYKSIGLYPGHGGWRGSINNGKGYSDPAEGHGSGGNRGGFIDCWLMGVSICLSGGFPNDGRGRVQDQNNDQSFEQALCNCIRKSISPQPPYWALPTETCWNYANDIWECARRATSPPPSLDDPWNGHAPGTRHDRIIGGPVYD